MTCSSCDSLIQQFSVNTMFNIITFLKSLAVIIIFQELQPLVSVLFTIAYLTLWVFSKKHRKKMF